MNTDVIIDGYSDFLPRNTIYNIIDTCMRSDAQDFQDFLNNPGNDYTRIDPIDWLIFLRGILIHVQYYMQHGQMQPNGPNEIEFSDMTDKFLSIIEYFFEDGNEAHRDGFLKTKTINKKLGMEGDALDENPILTQILEILLLDNPFLHPLPMQDKYNLYLASTLITKNAPFLELLAGQYNDITNIERAMRINDEAFEKVNNYLLDCMLERIFLHVQIANYTAASLPQELIKLVVNGGSTDPKEATCNYNQMWQILNALAEKPSLAESARNRIKIWLENSTVQDYYGMKNSKMHEG